MSDTDDTDLLLLFPPDFFLVQTPDLSRCDSECDIDFDSECNEIKDLIVSDLINQVNELESRVCMIESVDRSATHCSTCNEDSFANQSVNSLTESDILRPRFKEKSEPLSKDHFMCDSVEQGTVNDTDLHTQGHLTDICNAPSELVSIDKTSNKQLQSIYNATIDNIAILDDVKDKLSLDREHCQQELKLPTNNQFELLNEVDSFLDIKNKQKLNSQIENEDPKEKSVEIKSQDKDNSVLPSSDGLFNSEQFYKESECYNPEQSLALPAVYELLKEMEETQYEMEKKLKIHQFQPHSRDQIEIDNVTDVNRSQNSNKAHSLNALEFEDFYSKPKMGFNNKTESFTERLRNMQGNRNQISESNRPIMNTNPQLNYLLKPQSPGLKEERTAYEKDPKVKAMSPNRTLITGTDIYNPIDIVKANLPRKDSKTTVSLELNKQSPRKLAGFRRQLNFERPDLPLRSSKSKSSLYFEQNSKFQSENRGSDRLNIDIIQRTNRNAPGSSNPNLEEQFNSLAVQRATAENVNFAENKHSSNEILQSKISSNNLLSLSELWNKEPTFYSDDPNKLRQKLEEEKYRRQHCEQQIQVLQVRVLEEQEKLAVAIKVDQEKDKVILQITESWRKLNDHWSELEEQRHNLAQQLHEERESAKVKSGEFTKKIERWEKEVGQALDLAAGYKEKSESIQNQMELLKRDTEEKLNDARTQLHNLNQENEKIRGENSDLLQQLQSFQERIKEEEELLSKLKNELEKSKKQVLDYEAEVNVLKEQKETLSSKIKDEKNRSSILEQQKITLQQAVNEASKREKEAEEEARVSNERIEVARTELRAFYQGQLESVVKEKLQEFQSQLEAAEAALKAELRLKEQQWNEKANDQCRQLQENYKKELQHLEESHKENSNKWKMKLMESERLRNIVESRLQEETNRRADIAQRLHSVMETQWREALNIISNPMQNMYEMPKDEMRRWPSSQQSSERLKGCGDLKPSRTNSSASLVQTEEAPFCKDGAVTYRSSQPTQDSHLKKYIQMLLERGPGNPVPQHDSLQESFDQIYPSEEGLPANKWLMENSKKSGGQMERFCTSNKPPWK